MQTDPPISADRTLSRPQLWFILIAAYLSWFFAGAGMAVTTLVMRNAAIGLVRTPELPQPPEALVQQWVAWYTCAFLLGAACGGLLFGWIGDRRGRVCGMGWSVLCYSLGAGAGYFVDGPWQLLLVRFVACLGIGGVWPNAVAIVGETWPQRLRPTLAGILGTGANLGMVLLAFICVKYHVTPDHWRWVMVVAALPTLLGIVVLFCARESPVWLERQAMARTSIGGDQSDKVRQRSSSAFSREILPRTLIGIALGSIPLLGNWGSVNWLVTWADQVGSFAGRPEAKAWAQIARSVGGAVGSMLGGWAATLLGRRWSYFWMSLASLGVSQYVFGWLHPGDPQFLLWTTILGFASTIYLGWLPLCLPELFPVEVRSQGTGVSFNFGRFLSAAGVLTTGLLSAQFAGNYARIGQVTSLIFGVGMVIIWFAPDVQSRQLK